MRPKGPKLSARRARSRGLSSSPRDVSHAVPNTVNGAFRCPPGSQGCLFGGDRLLSIGGIRYNVHLRNRLLTPFSEIGEDGRIPVELSRNGEHLRFRALVRLPRKSVLSKLSDITPMALLPLILWTMGTVAILFLRPRDERWLILVLFSYIKAIWFAAAQITTILA